MKKNHASKKEITGFTLIEMILVLVVISIIVMMSLGYLQQRTLQIRVDRTATQMQQILNAGLSYYISNGSWPADLACLQGNGGCSVGYLPTNLTNAWGNNFSVVASPGSPSPLLYVYTEITGVDAFRAATTLVGRLPLAYATAASPTGIPANDGSCAVGATSCTIVASVNIPGQNLNNASAINFSGLYHNGACVPVPTCPVDARGNTMTAQIIVVPVSVSGINDAPTASAFGTCSELDQSGCLSNVYPISSFSAYATPMGSPPNSCAASGGNSATEPCYTDYTNSTQLSGNFWRVCLSTVTEKGIVSPTTNAWGQLQGTIMAVTRCMPKDEPSGSGFTVWSNQ